MKIFVVRKGGIKEPPYTPGRENDMHKMKKWKNEKNWLDKVLTSAPKN